MKIKKMISKGKMTSFKKILPTYSLWKYREISMDNLYLEIRKCASVATFKQSLKTFLFKLAYRL